MIIHIMLTDETSVTNCYIKKVILTAVAQTAGQNNKNRNNRQPR